MAMDRTEAVLYYGTILVTLYLSINSISMVIVLTFKSAVEMTPSLFVERIVALGLQIIFTALALISYYRVLKIHPGKVRKLLNVAFGPDKKGKLSSMQESVLSLALPAKERKASNGGRRFCRSCMLWKPDRTHHCRACQMCVLRYDHHCAFLNTCIGKDNHKHFMLFLFWGMVACFYDWYLLELLSSVPMMRRLHRFAGLWQLAHNILLAVFAIVLAIFLTYCMFLMFWGYTTIEFMEKRNKIVPFTNSKYKHPYGVPIMSSMRQICGSGPLIGWFFPSKRIQKPHNGIIFDDTRKKKE